MKKPELIQVAAVSPDWGIGSNNGLLYNDKEEMKFFKMITSGEVIIMGYKTFESLGCKPLKNRRNIVMTRNPAKVVAEGVEVATTKEEVLDMIKNENKAYIIGGDSIYSLWFEYCSKFIISHMKADSDKVADSFHCLKDHLDKVVIKHEKDNKTFTVRLYQKEA